jgi:hypothetical protein
MVQLLSSDNETFAVDKQVAERSILIKNMLEGEYLTSFGLVTILLRRGSAWMYSQPWLLLIINACLDVGESDAPIPLPNVTAKILKKVYPFYFGDIPPFHFDIRTCRGYWPHMFRSLTGASITEATLSHNKRRLTTERDWQKLTNGTKSSWRLTKKLFLKSFLYGSYLDIVVFSQNKASVLLTLCVLSW